MRVELIAETASNAGGQLPLAKEFIKRFAGAGADFVKFQTTRVRHLSPKDPQHEWFSTSEMSDDAHFELKACCEAEGTQFLTTIYNEAELPLVKALGCTTVKLGSGESRDADLRWKAGCLQPNMRVLASMHWTHTYMPGLNMMCVTRYPASERASLAAIDRMQHLGMLGYSDHSIGLEMARWAIECGARVLEKHVQLEGQARPQKPFEATVAEFKALRAFADEDPERFLNRWNYA